MSNKGEKEMNVLWVLFYIGLIITPWVSFRLWCRRSSPLYVTLDMMPELTREDLEKHHPGLMKALDNIPKMERENVHERRRKQNVVE